MMKDISLYGQVAVRIGRCTDRSRPVRTEKDDEESSNAIIITMLRFESRTATELGNSATVN